MDLTNKLFIGSLYSRLNDIEDKDKFMNMNNISLDTYKKIEYKNLMLTAENIKLKSYLEHLKIPYELPII